MEYDSCLFQSLNFAIFFDFFLTNSVLKEESVKYFNTLLYNINQILIKSEYGT